MDEKTLDAGYAEGWRPDEGAVLIGRVSDVGMGFSTFTNGNYPIVTVEPEGGGEPVAVHGFHAGLFSQLTQLRPVVGERIGFKYVGKRPHKTDKSKSVAVYNVRIEGRSADVWGQLAPPAPSGFAPAQPAPEAAPDDDIPF